ncbi:MAG: glutamine amidotransferase [Xanthomonadales bacterium]|nr:glutamine amidotransferase [Xanthomonadales bacterium]
MTRHRLLIVKTGAAFAEARRRFGDFDDWFARGIGQERFAYETVAVSDKESLPAPRELDSYSGVVVTGSSAMVSHKLDWSEAAADWLAQVIGEDRLPVLGVCYGHQLIAHALGGSVGPNPNGRRMGTRPFEIAAADDRLLGALAPRTSVHVTHLEAVLDPPDSARVVGRTEGDPHHALHFGGRCWGVQFHPEFDAAIMRCYVQARAALLEGEGFDSRAILENVSECPAGDAVLQQFAEICRSTRGGNNGK